MADTRYQILIELGSSKYTIDDYENLCEYFDTHVQVSRSTAGNPQDINLVPTSQFTDTMLVNFRNAGTSEEIKIKTGGNITTWPNPGQTYTIEYQFDPPLTKPVGFWLGDSSTAGPADATVAINSFNGSFQFTWGNNTTGEWYMKMGSSGTTYSGTASIKMGNADCPFVVQLEPRELEYLDTYQYEPIELTYNISDIQDISARNSSFSKTILLPDTKKNREIFGSISNLASDSNFDPNLKAKAWILVDSVPVFEGNIQLKNIKINDKLEAQYECVIYADNDTFFSRLGEKYLTDLDLISLSHFWTEDNIKNSWTDDWERGYFYPLIDYGQGWNYEQVSTVGASQSIQNSLKYVSIAEMFPAVYVKFIWDRIFQAAGFSYESDFLNSTKFKNLLIPFNREALAYTDEFFNALKFAVGRSSYPWLVPTTQNNSPNWFSSLPSFVKDMFAKDFGSPYYSNVTSENTDTFQYGQVTDLAYNIESPPPLSDPNDLWNTSSYIYTNYYPNLIQNFNFDFTLELPAQVNSLFGKADVFLLMFREFNPDGTLNSDWSGGWGYPIDPYAQQIFHCESEFWSTSVTYYGTTYTTTEANQKIFGPVDLDYTGGLMANNTRPPSDGSPTTFESGTYSSILTFKSKMMDDFTRTTGYAPLYENEKVRFKLVYRQTKQTLANINGDPNALYGTTTPQTLVIQNAVLYNDFQLEIPPNGFIAGNLMVPNQIKQKDFLMSIVKMFNLYIEPSKDNKNTLIIEPREDYYAKGQLKDWTDKIDLNEQINEQILADLQNKLTTFTYTKDSDYLNKYYNDSYSEIYGQYIHISDNEFTKDNQNISVIFAPSPLATITNSDNFVITNINAKADENNNFAASKLFKHTIRILTRNESGLLLFDNKTNAFVFENQEIKVGNYGAYPYAGHLDNPYDATYDLNWGQLREKFYMADTDTTNNLVNQYWLQFLSDTTGKDSRIITVSMYLTPTDIYNFKFNDTIYLFFNGNGQYYRVNKIENYDPGKIGTCQVELIKATEKPAIIKGKSVVNKPGLVLGGMNQNSVNVNGWNVNGSGGSGKPGQVVANGIINVGFYNEVKGDNSLVTGSFNQVSGRKISVNGDNNKVISSPNSVSINGDDNILGIGQSVTVNGKNNILRQKQDNIVINGDENYLEVNTQWNQTTCIYTFAMDCTTGVVGLMINQPPEPPNTPYLQRWIIERLNGSTGECRLYDCDGNFLETRYLDTGTTNYLPPFGSSSSPWQIGLFAGPGDPNTCYMEFDVTGVRMCGSFSITPYTETISGTFGICSVNTEIDKIYVGNTCNPWPGCEQYNILLNNLPVTVDIWDCYGNILGTTSITYGIDCEESGSTLEYIGDDGWSEGACYFTYDLGCQQFFTVPFQLTCNDGIAAGLIISGDAYDTVIDFVSWDPIAGESIIQLIDPNTGLPFECGIISGRQGIIVIECEQYYNVSNIKNKDILITGGINHIVGSNSNVTLSGNNNIVGTSSKSLSVVGNQNNIGQKVSDLWLFGNNNTITDGVKGSFVIGDGQTITQSNTTFITNNLVITGTVSGFGLQKVLETGPTASIIDQTVSIETSIDIPNNLPKCIDLNGFKIWPERNKTKNMTLVGPVTTFTQEVELYNTANSSGYPAPYNVDKVTYIKTSVRAWSQPAGEFGSWIIEDAFYTDNTGASAPLPGFPSIVTPIYDNFGGGGGIIQFASGVTTTSGRLNYSLSIALIAPGTNPQALFVVNSQSY